MRSTVARKAAGSWSMTMCRIISPNVGELVRVKCFTRPKSRNVTRPPGWNR